MKTNKDVDWDERRYQIVLSLINSGFLNQISGIDRAKFLSIETENIIEYLKKETNNGKDF